MLQTNKQCNGLLKNEYWYTSLYSYCIAYWSAAYIAKLQRRKLRRAPRRHLARNCSQPCTSYRLKECVAELTWRGILRGPIHAHANIPRRQCSLQNWLHGSANKNSAAATCAHRHFPAQTIYCKPIGLRHPRTKNLLPPLARADIFQRQCSLQNNRFEASPNTNSAAANCARRHSPAPTYIANRSV